MNLAEKTCTPCRGGVPPLTVQEAEELRGQAEVLRDELLHDGTADPRARAPPDGRRLRQGQEFFERAVLVLLLGEIQSHDELEVQVSACRPEFGPKL